MGKAELPPNWLPPQSSSRALRSDGIDITSRNSTRQLGDAGITKEIFRANPRRFLWVKNGRPKPFASRQDAPSAVPSTEVTAYVSIGRLSRQTVTRTTSALCRRQCVKKWCIAARLLSELPQRRGCRTDTGAAAAVAGAVSVQVLQPQCRLFSPSASACAAVEVPISWPMGSGSAGSSSVFRRSIAHQPTSRQAPSLCPTDL